MTTIVGVKLDNRLASAVKFQEILVKYGCNIHTRIGLHSSPNNQCSEHGIILLEVVASPDLLINELSEYWSVQTMFFE